MQAIAITGMACRYPDARSPQELWENVLAQRKAFRRIPAERLNLDDYYHPERETPDRTYSSQGAFLTNYVFERERFRISGKTYRSSDLAHWLALDVAEKALADAGFSDGRTLPTTSTGVLVGNTLTGEFSRAQLLRLRWPYVARVVTHALLQENWQTGEIQRFLTSLEEEYKRPFAPVNEETLAGGLSNTIAGRICNYFDLKGGGYTVDGACSSSLLAIIHACKALEAFDVDVALAGGVDLSIDPFEIIGFAKTAALAVEEMRVYDVYSRGFLPGEGCGFLVLMRYEDALAQGCRIYATIRGWGISSDGSGGITRPEVEGQRLALERAYRHAGTAITTVPYFEGHGTGTSVGDATELQALTFAREQVRGRGEQDAVEKASVSSVKANIGHTKAAAGAAGVIKAAMAVFKQIIPPTTGVVEPHAELTRPDAQLQVLRQGKLWPADSPLLAGVSSMGFGGINAHLVLGNTTRERRYALTSTEQRLLSSFQDAELFLLRARDREALQAQIAHLLTLAPRLSGAELTDLAVHLASHLQEGEVRAALVASKPRELTQRLAKLQELLSAGVAVHVDPAAQLYLGSGTGRPRIAFLFPGQGSPAHLNGGLLRLCFSEVDALYQRADLPEDIDGKRTEVAQPAITTASLASLLVLEQLGIQAQVGIGHSLGELSALHWAGVIDPSALLRIARARGQAMARVKSQDGAMLSLKADAWSVSELLRNTSVVIAGLNSPHQTVVSGDLLSVNTVAARARARKIPAVSLAVSHAFHSPLVAPAADALASCLQKERFSAPRRTLVSTITGDVVKDDNIAQLLYRQVTEPVRFLEAVEKVQDSVDLFIEVGPGQTLTGLVRDMTTKPAIATDAGGPSISGILAASAAAFALGVPLDTHALFGHRFSRPFDLNWQPSFLANPCEYAPLSEIERGEPVQANTSEPEESLQPTAPTILALVQQIIAARAELPLDLIEPGSRMLSDLHLNSLTVGHIFAEASRALGITSAASLLKYADASLAEIVQTLEDLQHQESPASEHAHLKEPEGLAEWVRCFEVVNQELPPVGASPLEGRGTWRVFAPEDYRFTAELVSLFEGIKGSGCVVCLPADLDHHAVSMLLQAAQAVSADRDMTHFVLIQHGKTGAAFARTLSLEYPHLSVCVLHLPDDLPAYAQVIAAEVAGAEGFVEVSYDGQHKRTAPVLLPYAPTRQDAPLALGTGDVLLVTGGGKGIAAECALALARATGSELALFGRSNPQHDADLAAHLARLDDAGVRYHYVPVDVQNASAVAQAMREIEACLGPVTALLHAAGANHPQLLNRLDEESFNQALAPKVSGLQHLLDALSEHQLKYLVTFGSVIARTGMQGEAHYALANEWLAELTEAYQRRSPATMCLCIEWSIWSGVGMGERLGSVATLRAEGITPIPLEQGLAVFLKLLAQRQQTTRVIVSGRLGAAPTLKIATRPLPFLRFLEKTRLFYPGIELITEAEVSVDTDPYLNDHQLQHERLLPGVVGLEAMAQLAQAVTGQQTRPAFKDVEFIRPLIVPDQAAVTLRLMALVLENGSVEVAIRCSETAYQVNHFQAICSFAPLDQEIKPGLPRTSVEQIPVQLQPLDDLYGRLLFHRGRFQRISRYLSLHAWECQAEITLAPDTAWFGRYLPQELILGDPASRDAFIHAIQPCIPQATLLPVSVESLVFTHQPATPGQPVEVYAQERDRQGNVFIYDLEARDSSGVLLEQWRGLRLQMVGQALSPDQWAATLLGPYAERRLADFAPTARRLLSFQQTADATLAVKLLDPDQGATLTTVIQAQEEDAWHDQLGTSKYTLAANLQTASNEDFSSAATRVLAAAELARRAGLPSATPLILTRTEEDGWQVLEAGPLVLATFATHPPQALPLVFAFSCPLNPGLEQLSPVSHAERR